jgi:hypothetical protein
MNEHSVTQSQHELAEAITDQIMDRIHTGPNTDGLWDAFFHPFTHHTQKIVKHVTAPVSKIVNDNIHQAEQWQRSAEKNWNEQGQKAQRLFNGQRQYGGAPPGRRPQGYRSG